MRLAGHTYSFRHRPLGDALDELESLDLEFVEVWLGHAKEGPAVAADAVRERGLEAVAVSAGGVFDLRIGTHARACELAAALGTPVVVASVPLPLVDPLVETLPAGIVLCLENHWDQSLATAPELRGALPGGTTVMACLDTGHALMAGRRPEHFAAALGARLGHVHLKEARFAPLVVRAFGRRLRRRFLGRPPAVFPGQGDLSVGNLRRSLRDADFQGAVTLEYEGAEAAAALAELRRRWRSAETRSDPAS